MVAHVAVVRERERFRKVGARAFLDNLKERSLRDVSTQVSISSKGSWPSNRHLATRWGEGWPLEMEVLVEAHLHGDPRVCCRERPQVPRHDDDISAAKTSRCDNWAEVFWPDAADEGFTEAWLLPVASDRY
ncbi:hypothetical protein F4803DRAFT_524602 [Xylaria telfairii]|nr:hypothetical protein F4803DRAFT_524602 [Xylaria telfairii]